MDSDSQRFWVWLFGYLPPRQPSPKYSATNTDSMFVRVLNELLHSYPASLYYPGQYSAVDTDGVWDRELKPLHDTEPEGRTVVDASVQKVHNLRDNRSVPDHSGPPLQTALLQYDIQLMLQRPYVVDIRWIARNKGYSNQI